MSPHRVLQYRQPLWCCRIDGEMHQIGTTCGKAGKSQPLIHFSFRFPLMGLVKAIPQHAGKSQTMKKSAMVGVKGWLQYVR